MSRPAALVPNAHLHIRLAPDLKAKLDLLLFSELEARIPKGAHKDFIESRLREFFDWQVQSLERFGLPDGYFIAGPKEMVQALTNKLEGFSA